MLKEIKDKINQNAALKSILNKLKSFVSFKEAISVLMRTLGFQSTGKAADHLAALSAPGAKDQCLKEARPLTHALEFETSLP